MSFVDDFLDMMPDVVIATPVSLDGYGGFTASGAPLSLQCMIEGNSRLTRDSNGREVVSSVQVIVGSFNNLTTEGHRYTLPVRYNPRTDLQAISIEKVSDEEGSCYEVVYLP